MSRAVASCVVAMAASWLGAVPAAAGLARCGGYVRAMNRADVEVAVRAERIEVRVRNQNGMPVEAEGAVSLVASGQPRRIALRRAGDGLLVADAGGNVTARTVVVRLVFADGAVGALRFPVRAAVCADPLEAPQ